MKQFFNVYSFALLSLGLTTPLYTQVAMHQGMPAHAAPAHMSVHDMFRDVSQDELLAMMEEGQRFIQYLEQHGTEEDKMAFAQAMEQTLQSFTEDDWKEFEAIVDTVQDKLPPLMLEPQEEVKPAPQVKEDTPKEKKPTVIDNSLEKILHQIHKAVNAILLKAKSDKILMERITSQWDKKDDFNEMIRLLQVLQKKELLEKLNAPTDEDTKLLIQSIQNFNKRLQVENDQFVIADTFGLEIDEETTATNLKKLNKIIEFFESGIGSLLPKLVKFMQAYEPDALQKAKEHDEQAKKALDHAQKVEKQKRPNGNLPYHGRVPSHGSYKPNNHDLHRPANYGGYTPAPSTEHPHNYLQDVHHDHVKEAKARMQKASSQQGTDKEKSEKEKKDAKKSGYDKAIDILESHMESFGNQDLGAFTATIKKAHAIYKPFGTAITEADKTRAQKLQETRDAATQLKPDELLFLKKYNDQRDKAQQSFAKNTQQAQLAYEELKESFEKLHPQIDDMIQTLQELKRVFDQMTAKELDQFEHSVSLKNFDHQINAYYDQFKSVQRDLKKQHKSHILDSQEVQITKDDLRYNELSSQISSLYGLDKKLSDLQSQFTAFKKSIKSAIARKKREENKAASQQ